MRFIYMILLTLLMFTVAIDSPKMQDNPILVLNYHHLVPEETDNPVTITPERFEQHLSLLASEGWHSISLKQLEAYLTGNSEPENPSYLITFDDGYQSVYDYAYPLMLDYKVYGVVFHIGKYLDPNFNEYIYLPRLTTSHIQEMMASGYFTLQSHTYDLHLPLTSVPISEIEADLDKATETLSLVSSEPIYALAYPHGMYNKEILDMLETSSISLAFAGGDKLASGADPLEIPRFSMDNKSEQQLANILRKYSTELKAPDYILLTLTLLMLFYGLYTLKTNIYSILLIVALMFGIIMLLISEYTLLSSRESLFLGSGILISFALAFMTAKINTKYERLGILAMLILIFHLQYDIRLTWLSIPILSGIFALGRALYEFHNTRSLQLAGLIVGLTGLGFIMFMKLAINIDQPYITTVTLHTWLAPLLFLSVTGIVLGFSRLSASKRV